MFVLLSFTILINSKLTPPIDCDTISVQMSVPFVAPGGKLYQEIETKKVQSLWVVMFILMNLNGNKDVLEVRISAVQRCTRKSR